MFDAPFVNECPHAQTVSLAEVLKGCHFDSEIKDRTIAYANLVPEVTEELDYDRTLAAAKAAR